MGDELAKKICSALTAEEALKIAIDRIEELEKFDNSKNIGYPTSKVDTEKTLQATGFLTNGCIIKYDSMDMFARYQVDFENILPYLVIYMRKNNIDTLGEVVGNISNFLISYFGVKQKQVDLRSDYQYALIGQQIGDKKISDKEYIELFNRLKLSDFKGKGLAECTEYTSVSQCIMSLFGMNPIMVLGRYYDKNLSDYHAFNVACNKDGKLMVLDSANPHLLFDENGNLLFAQTTYKFFDDITLEEFLNGEKDLKVERYNGVKANDGKISYLDYNIEILSSREGQSDKKIKK